MIYFEALDAPFFTRYKNLKTMEHPIPQNVTTFEFHLVGDMTLKQFGYLGGGAALAYLTYVIGFPLNPYISTPLIAIFALLGVAFAFLPILDRPLDHWVGAFFKAVYSPTQGSWQLASLKNTKVNYQDPFYKNRLQLFLSSLTPQQVIPSQIPSLRLPVASSPPPSPVSKKDNKFDLQRVAPKIEEKPVPPPPPPNSPQMPQAAAPSHPLPSPEELNKLVEMAHQSQMLQARIVVTEKQIAQLQEELRLAKSQPAQSNPLPAANKPANPPQFKQMLGNLETLLQQTQTLYQQNTQLNKNITRPHKPNVVVVQPPKETKTQLALTSTPNVINGVVSDTGGSYLESVIVIIHNKDGIPVRALKTNKLGQFAGATPLPSGTYTITLEKDGFEFDTLQITLSGEAIMPLMIQAKRGGR